jgi:hypothetical protein
MVANNSSRIQLPSHSKAKKNALFEWQFFLQIFYFLSRFSNDHDSKFVPMNKKCLHSHAFLVQRREHIKFDKHFQPHALFLL